ncbi:hypothetical protein AMTRI_Chr09g38690 [Amborella trichopoda]
MLLLAQGDDNDISCLTIPGIDSEDNATMEGGFINHFNNAFTKEVFLKPSFANVPFKVLEEEQAVFLEKSISIKELKMTVFAMSGDKASDPDRDLLSPFLFTIYAKCFSMMLSREESSGAFSSFKIVKSDITASHLQYADDTLVFCDAKAVQLENIARFLEICEVIMGIKVNLHKSSLVGVNCAGSLVENLARVVGRKVDSFPIFYLGLPIYDSKLSVAVWDKVIERVQVKLDLWKHKYLSLGGRLTLLRSCLANLLVYQMSVIQIPAAIGKRIEKMMRDFM